MRGLRCRKPSGERIGSVVRRIRTGEVGLPGSGSPQHAIPQRRAVGLPFVSQSTFRSGRSCRGTACGRREPRRPGCEDAGPGPDMGTAFRPDAARRPGVERRNFHDGPVDPGLLLDAPAGTAEFARAGFGIEERGGERNGRGAGGALGAEPPERLREGLRVPSRNARSGGRLVPRLR